MKLIQQKLMIRILLGALVEAVMTHEIGDFQTHPPILLIKVENGGKEVQDQRTHMPIKNFLKTFLCQNFLKKRADCHTQIAEKALQKPLSLRVEYLKLPL